MVNLWALPARITRLAFPAVPDLAGDRAFKKAVTQPFHHDGFQMRERLSQLAVMRASSRRKSESQALCSSAFMSLMVAENGSAGTVAPAP